MKIELELSEKNEGTESPYWLILDPRQMLSLNVSVLSSMITGPFFSREDAEIHLKNRRYAFSHRAVVYCCSGYWSTKYKEAIRKTRKEIK